MADNKRLHVEPDSPEWHAIRAKARDDLWFLNKMLGHEPWLPMRERVHYPMIRFAERKTGVPEIDDQRVQMILVSRECGKSTGITKARSIQRVLQNPDYAMMIGNESTRLAKAFLGEIKAVFEHNEFIRTFFPELLPANWQDTIWSADQIVVKRTTSRPAPTVLAAGVDTTVTGFHFDEIVVDDPISREAAENARSGSFTEIEQVNRWMHTLEPLLNGPGCPITIIGTPWWQNDTYAHAREIWGDQEEHEVEWLCELPSGGSVPISVTVTGELAIYKRPVIENGASIFPEKWPEERLQRMQRTDPVLFASNILLNPAADIVRDLKDEWLRWYEWDTPFKFRYRKQDGTQAYMLVKDLDTIMAVDPAITESAKGDRSGIVVSGTSDGAHHIILEARAERVGVLELCNKILDLWKRYKCRRVYVEAVAYQKALAQILFARGVPVVPVQPGTQRTKEMRIRSMEPFFRRGQVYMHSGMFDLTDEYRSFPRGKHDDLLDALSYLSDEWARLAPRQAGGLGQLRADVDAQNIARIKHSLSYRRR